jgi:type IV secretion system protein VirB1
MPAIDLQCPAMAVPMALMRHVVSVESAFNPYAIGVVGGHLLRQPRNLAEALATAGMLEKRGFNFSLGLAQVNRHNLKKYGLESYKMAFQACPNLQAGARILAECYNRSGKDWGRSFSCYYSGNFVTGYRDGYVRKVFESMTRSSAATEEASALAIAVSGRSSRRVSDISRYPTNKPSSVSRRVAMSEGIAIAAGPSLQPTLPVALVPTDGQPTAYRPEATPSANDAGNAASRDAAFVF